MAKVRVNYDETKKVEIVPEALTVVFTSTLTILIYTTVYLTSLATFQTNHSDYFNSFLSNWWKASKIGFVASLVSWGVFLVFTSVSENVKYEYTNAIIRSLAVWFVVSIDILIFSFVIAFVIAIQDLALACSIFIMIGGPFLYGAVYVNIFIFTFFLVLEEY